jgi:hypothetical protein
MADESHFEVLRQAIEKENIKIWNEWKKAHPSGVDLTNVNLVGLLSDKKRKRLSPVVLGSKGLRTQLPGIDLSGASMWRSNLEFVDLPGANLAGADLAKANLRRANLSNANLRDAHLYEVDFYQASIANADLSGARLTRARLVETDVQGCIFRNCNIYGVSVWNLGGTPKEQSQLTITEGVPNIVVDNLEVAQFVFLLIRHEKIREVIQTLGKKAVLILGRFSPERKEVLDAIAEQLRQSGYLPIIFDFEKSSQRDFTETIKILAGLSLFVIADITKPSSSPLELDATVPDYMIPFAPIIQKGEKPFSMFANLQNKYSWVMDVREYKDKQELLANLERSIIRPALELHNELLVKRAEGLRIRPVTDIP